MQSQTCGVMVVVPVPTACGMTEVSDLSPQPLLELFKSPWLEKSRFEVQEDAGRRR